MSLEKKITLLGIPFDALTMRETVDLIDTCIQKNKYVKHSCVNAAVIVAMQSDPELRSSIMSSDIINADGLSIIWASRFLGNPLPERVAGPDLMESLVKLSSLKGYRIFLLGAKEDIVQKVASVYSSKFSPQIISGFRNGYFNPSDESQIVKQIAASQSQILFVAITSPKKELFLNKHAKDLNVPYIMGVGGAFDIVAGVTKRAPKWMQSIGMEWFYRLVQEPGRMWKRYLKSNTSFILSVIKEKFLPK